MSVLTKILRRGHFRRAQPRPDEPPRLDELQQKIHYTFHDRTLLSRSLVHRSFIHAEEHDRLPSNERLEFLGDAFLGFVIAIAGATLGFSIEYYQHGNLWGYVSFGITVVGVVIGASGIAWGWYRFFHRL